jgi:membrane-associated phospholipid phosphatase
MLVHARRAVLSRILELQTCPDWEWWILRVESHRTSDFTLISLFTFFLSIYHIQVQSLLRPRDNDESLPSGHATRHTSAATGMPVAYPKAHSTGPDSERDIGMVSL